MVTVVQTCIGQDCGQCFFGGMGAKTLCVGPVIGPSRQTPFPRQNPVRGCFRQTSRLWSLALPGIDLAGSPPSNSFEHAPAPLFFSSFRSFEGVSSNFLQTTAKTGRVSRFKPVFVAPGGVRFGPSIFPPSSSLSDPLARRQEPISKISPSPGGCLSSSPDLGLTTSWATSPSPQTNTTEGKPGQCYVIREARK